MTLQTSGPISMNEINRELKGYTASGTSISLASAATRRMAGGPDGSSFASLGPISMSDFYGDQSHIAVTTGTVLDTSGYPNIMTSGYIKDYYSSGSHLGSLSSVAGVYIPSSGDTLNMFTEREVLECYTVNYSNSSTRYFYLKLSGQIYSGNTFTGIREMNPFGYTSGVQAKALADATFSSASTFNAWDQWMWTTTTYWSSGTKYIHWY